MSRPALFVLGTRPALPLLPSDACGLQCPHVEQRLVEMQRLSTLGMLTPGIAHDFNNVLSSMLALASTLADQLEPQHPAQSSVSQLHKATQRARGLMGQVLSFSRPTTGVRDTHVLQDLLGEAVDLLRPSVPPTSTLRVDSCSEPLPVQADATAIVQLVLNLCLNALQALPNGRGSVTVTLQRAQVQADEGPMAQLLVADDGIGMDAATRRRIFEPYFSTRSETGGTGLGLATVSHVLTQHGGRVGVHSTPGQGSVFDVTLPLHAASMPARAPQAGTQRPPVTAARPQRVLLVDDDSVLRVMIEAVLAAHGHLVTACDSATGALKAWRNDPQAFDLIVSDHNLGGQSGLDLARAMLESHPATRFILVSGHVDSALTQAAGRDGVHRVMSKADLYDHLPTAVANLAQPAR